MKFTKWTACHENLQIKVNKALCLAPKYPCLHPPCAAPAPKSAHQCLHVHVSNVQDIAQSQQLSGIKMMNQQPTRLNTHETSPQLKIPQWKRHVKKRSLFQVAKCAGPRASRIFRPPSSGPGRIRRQLEVGLQDAAPRPREMVSIRGTWSPEYAENVNVVKAFERHTMDYNGIQ